MAIVVDDDKFLGFISFIACLVSIHMEVPSESSNWYLYVDRGEARINGH
jgi:hypothetical protein